MSQPSDLPLHRLHPRRFQENRYVYPVLSRRARGVSIGVNLNRDKRCNFRCVYCQVDRADAEPAEPIDLARLADELDRAVEHVASGAIFDGPRFAAAPPALRRLNDIALSGDGEPTLCPELGDVVEACAEVRRRRRLDDVKLVLITNATLLGAPRVRQALQTLMANHGEIWAKLDAGTEAYYRRVARSAVPFEQILANLTDAARRWPIVIQSLFMRIDGRAPELEEQQAYCDRLSEIVASGGRLADVQIHTIARQPAEPWVAPLSDAEIDALGALVRRRTGLVASLFYGA
ncbi:MAG: radical SAM protein [Pirellulales bacterium]|nr:radical SAM protein [Pirellulales bacterium]